MSDRPSDRVDEQPASHQITGTGSAIWGADSYALRGHTMSARRVGRRTLEQIRAGLSERDIAVLESVDEFRLLTAPQVEALWFADHASRLAGVRASRRVLERLTRDRLLVRLGRRVGGVRAGSASYIYAIGPIGHRVLHDDTTRRWREPSASFVAHTLAVAQIVVDLRVAQREGRCDLVTYECEPNSWRTFTRGLGARETLKPDLHIVTGDEHDEWWWFVEVDLGTESGTAIARKCRTYHDYWTTGTEQGHHGAYPKVLWIADTERRVDFISQTIAKTRTINQDLFAVAIERDATAVLAGGRP